MFEVFSCGDSSHFAVRFPVRVQALDNELGHLQAGGKSICCSKVQRARGCTEEIMRKPILPFPPLRLAHLDRRMLLGQWDRREKDPRSAPRGKELPWIDEQADLEQEEETQAQDSTADLTAAPHFS